MPKYDATIFQYDVIADRVRKIQKDEELELNKTKCLMYLYLQQELGLDRIEILDSIVDGPDDFGIDAIYIDQDDQRVTVYLLQSKFYENREKYSRTFEQNALTKMKDAINDLIANPKSMPDFANAMLRAKLETIHELGADNVHYEVVFLGNCYPPTETGQTSFKEFIDRFNKYDEIFTVSYIGLNELTEMLPTNREQRIDAEIRLDGDVMIQDLGAVRTLTGRVPAAELVKLMELHKNALFDKNVRGYLKKSNQVNKKIFESATGNDALLFFVLNNGLTIVCTKYVTTTQMSSPNVKLQGVQIVNGGQTTNTIYEAYKKSLLKPDVSALIKIIQTEDGDILQKITEATNSQTLVRNRDLHSNDPIQKLIEDALETRGYFYEARRNKYQGIKSPKQRVDAERAAQTYYAFVKQEPASAKTNKSKLFSDKYSEIFNSDEFDTDNFLYAYRLFDKQLSFRTKFEEEYGFLRDAELTSLALLRDLIDDREAFLKDKELFEKTHRKILGATKKIVDEEVARLKDKFEKRRLFIDPKTLGRIKEKI